MIGILFFTQHQLCTEEIMLDCHTHRQKLHPLKKGQDFKNYYGTKLYTYKLCKKLPKTMNHKQIRPKLLNLPEHENRGVSKDEAFTSF